MEEVKEKTFTEGVEDSQKNEATVNNPFNPLRGYRYDAKKEEIRTGFSR